MEICEVKHDAKLPEWQRRISARRRNNSPLSLIRIEPEAKPPVEE